LRLTQFEGIELEYQQRLNDANSKLIREIKNDKGEIIGVTQGLSAEEEKILRLNFEQTVQGRLQRDSKLALTAATQNMNAVMGDCEYTKSLNAAILDNILGSVVVTDYNFNITDYNLSASSTLTSDCETSDLTNKESHLHRLSGTNLTKFLTVNIRDILKKRETATETLCVNDNLYRTIIKAVKVREEIKGWMFVFYKIDESGNFVDVLDRRKRD
jgi:hypothetical protein